MKDKLIEVARDTVNIQKRGYYDINNKTVFISEDMKKCIKNTVLYKDDFSVEKTENNSNCKFEFTNETTLAAAKRLYDTKKDVCVLNFASAKHPGGGFLKGTMAQEESIAYVSGLYQSLNKFDEDFYKYHLSNLTPFYSDRIIYSKRVPVFKTEKYELLEIPYYINIITSPAVNAGIVKQRNNPEDIDKINPIMENRIRKIIKTAILNGDKNLVLGAFGCGVFKNDLSDVAKLFKQILIKEKYKDYFENITFAIYDKTGMDAVNTFKARFIY